MRARIEVSATGKNLFSQPKCLEYFWSVGRSAIEDEQSNSVDVRLAVSSILMHMQSTRTSTSSVSSYSLAHSCSFTFVVKYRTYGFLILRLILFLDLDLELDLLNKLVLVC